MNEFRSGFACFVGRPNAGKSTLTNALVGSKVAIMSDRPQTTRRAIRGIVHRPEGQLIVVDTPGLHKPKTLLGQRLNDVVRDTLSDVDVIGFCMPANEPAGHGDRWILNEVKSLAPKTPIIAVITKTDLVAKPALALRLVEISGLADFAEIVPVSARKNDQVELLAKLFIDRFPIGPPLYPADEITDETEEGRISELIREAALEGVREELPHSIAVMIEEIKRREGRDDLLDVYALIYVERDTQKAIIIGHKGERLKDVGTRARVEIEKLLGTRIYLDLRVKIAKDWQRDPKQMQRLGF